MNTPTNFRVNNKNRQDNSKEQIIQIKDLFPKKQNKASKLVSYNIYIIYHRICTFVLQNFNNFYLIFEWLVNFD
jgi:hypothetical protein